jgi:hypothetical protein
MCNILREQNLNAMTRQFMPRLLEYGHFLQITKEIQAVRLNKYFNALKRPYLLRKMESFCKRKLAHLTVKRSFAAFQEYTDHMKNVKTYADNRYKSLQEDTLKACFDAFKSRLYLSQCRKFALGSYGMLILRRAFNSLSQNAQKNIYMRQAHNEIVR